MAKTNKKFKLKLGPKECAILINKDLKIEIHIPESKSNKASGASLIAVALGKALKNDKLMLKLIQEVLDDCKRVENESA